MQPDEEQLQEIRVIAQRIYPGKSLEQLTEDEKRNLFRSYRNTKSLGQDMHAAGTRMKRDAGKTVGPLGVYVNSPIESFAGGLMSGAGIGMQIKANRDQAAGRETAAELKTRQDALDAEQRRKEEEWRRQMLSSITSKGAFI